MSSFEGFDSASEIARGQEGREPRRGITGALPLLLYERDGPAVNYDETTSDPFTDLEEDVRLLRIAAERLCRQAHRELPRRDRASRGFLTLVSEAQ